MSNTYKARVPMKEQLRLINECRQSGMTDADWCPGIAVNIFCDWVSRCRKVTAGQIPVPNYGHPDISRLGKVYIVFGYTDMRKSINGL